MGRLVAGMIRRSVRSRFHSVYWRRCPDPIECPVIFYANHHGWMDGYLMFHLVTALGVPCVDWIEEFDAFPLFSYVGGLRFAKGDVAGRARTIRQTIRLMNAGTSLVLFPEGVLHRPPGILSFGRSLELVSRKVAKASLVPVAIRYELSLHERPEAWLWMGSAHGFESLPDCEDRLRHALELLSAAVSASESFTLLTRGTRDVNERLDMRRFDKS